METLRKWVTEYSTSITICGSIMVACGCVYMVNRIWTRSNKCTTRNISRGSSVLGLWSNTAAAKEIQKRQADLLAHGVVTGNLELVESLIKAGTSMEDIASVTFLPAKPASLDFNFEVLNQLSIIEIGALKGNVDVMKQLLGSTNKPKSNTNRSLLCLAVLGNHLEMVKFLVEELHVNVNESDSSRGLTALHEAVKLNNINMVAYLIASGADVNATSDEEQATPIIFAQSAEMCTLLLTTGADVLHRTTKGLSPLLVFAVNNLPEALDCLIDLCGVPILMAQMKLEVQDYFIYASDGEVALWLASMHGFVAVVQVLLDRDVDVEAVHPISGDSALQLAIMFGHDEVLQVLRNHGASSSSIDLDKIEYFSKNKDQE